METELEREIRQDAGKHLDKALISTLVQEWVEGRARPVEIHKHVRSVVRLTIAEALPKPVPEFGPRDNSSAWWRIGIGIFIMLCGIVTAVGGTGGVWPYAALIVGLFFAVTGFSNWTSEAAHREEVKDAEKRIMDAWHQQQVNLMTSTCERFYVQLHSILGQRSGVPSRLLPDFVKESVAHTERTRNEWRVAWWASQPTYPPAPSALSQRLGHYEYEEYCAQWLRSVGWEDAKVTQYSQDGGVDIVTAVHAVQCKHYDGGSVGAPAVREIFGVAAAESKTAVVFTSSRFTIQARAFADHAGVALVHLDELVGDAQPLNRAGHDLLEGPEPL